MSIRNGRSAREPMAVPDDADQRRPNGYKRTGRYGRGPGDQRRYERYGDQRGRGGILRFILFLAILAVAVLVVLTTVARPLTRALVVPWAEGNPGALRIGFVADLYREALGGELTRPAGISPATIEFTVEPGDTPAALAPRLVEQGIITSERAFLFEALMAGLAGRLDAGRYRLAANLTPAEVVTGLVENKIVIQTLDVTFREGLRIEQMTAKLATIDSAVDPAEFYKLAMDPPDSILGDFPWILVEDVRPKGASLEGFLYPATYTLRIDSASPTTADDLIRMMLNAFYDQVGPERMAVPEKRGLTFYEILILASIVEREAVLDEERALIAGVYQNRLNPKMWATGLLESDPTIFYTHDTLKLDEMKIKEWTKYVFWDSLPEGYQLPVPLPKRIAGYNTYTSKGLPPSPICSPSVASIDAALAPNTKAGYLFFIAKGDGTDSSAFAKTLAQHQKNVAKYGKNSR